jgi:hypothetical protein
MQNNASFSYSVNQKASPKSKKVNKDRIIYAIIFAILYGLLALLNFSARQYSIATVYIGTAITLVLIVYFLNRYNVQIRPRIGIGILLIALGTIFFFIVDTADFFFGFAGMFTAGISETSAIVAILVALFLCSAAVLVALTMEISRQGMKLRQLLTKRILLPYAVAAMIILSAYIVVITGLQFDFAIPVTFIVMGILVLAGLRRFAVTTTTTIVLLSCILILGVLASGTFTVTRVPENHYITTTQVPITNTIYLNVSTLQGNIMLTFNNDSNQVCHIAFVKEYGPVAMGNGVQFISKTNYNRYESPSNFSYTTLNGKTNITATSNAALVTITLNENYKVNLTLFSYFGGITVNISGSHDILSISAHSKWGYVSYT